MAKATPQTKGATNAKAGATSAQRSSPAGAPTPPGNPDAEALASADTTNFLAAQANSSQAGAEGATEGETLATAPVAPAPKPDPQAKREYVVGTLPIRHDGRFYGVGYGIELTDAQAQRLSALVVLVSETPKE